jgi:phosphoserine phosphatase
MSPDTFAALRRDLADRDILSVYIRAEEHDPTQRSSWRLRLKQALGELERDVSPEQAAAYATARAAVEAELQRYAGSLPGRGWALFASDSGTHHAAQEPVPLPDQVRWQRGPVLGPLTRAIRQDRRVQIVLIDSLRARLFDYRDGALEEPVDQRADAFIDDLADRNMSKRAATASGTRGATATDTADRILRVELERHAQRVAEAVCARADDSIVIAGGPTTAVMELRKRLEPVFGERLHIDETLHMAMTPAQIVAPIEEAASLITARLQEHVVRDLLEAATPGGPVALGMEETGRACVLGQVERLYLTARAIADQEAQAEQLIAAALDRGGAVELLSGRAAEVVDTNSAGVAGRLRYAPGIPKGTVESIRAHA